MIYTSGVIGVDPKTGEAGVTIEEQTRQVFENLRGLLADAGKQSGTGGKGLPSLSKTWTISARSTIFMLLILPVISRHAPAWRWPDCQRIC